ncbi:dicarboxylate/amino acid:cation symporter [uncultured Dysosmobacter sp.]|uniref:dicarboxylate/amino acid:cation symporter n=1 Tax=uncultured Dysosmobacter sp. TaxID=2591384 RepID=UPI002628E754|nr:dicarboxylate/amino acid:cation symporter [uncultured Dysosmobacter sp.]
MENSNESKKAMSLGKKSIIGLVAGLIIGAILCFVPASTFRDSFLIGTVFKIIGTGYLNLIKMTIVPFVFASLVMGISSATDVRQVGRIGSKILIIYMATTVVASIFGILGGMILKPGVGVNLGSFDLSTEYSQVQTSFADVVLDFIPTNVVGSFADGKMIHIVVFAVFVGIAISLIGEKAEPVKKFNESLANVMLKIVNIVMSLTPYGVCCLMASTVANLGFDIIVTLAKYCASEIFLFFLFGFVVYGLMFRMMTGQSFFKLLKKYSKIALVPFSTSSSNATIPYSIQFCRSVGVSEKVAAFSIPLGATLNMDGTAIMQGMTFVFVSQLYNIELTLPMLVTIIITITLATIGSPGMPGVVMVTLTLVLQSVGFPLEAIAIIVAIDKFPDMFKTVLNVLGDAIDTIIVAKSEGEFDADVFNDLKQGEVTL